VGYSAAVPNYFFRGTLSVQQPEHENNIVEVCSHPNGDFEPVGTLNVGFTISPSDLSFGGTASLYYDLPGGNRILAEMGQFSPSNTEGALSTTIFLDQLALFVPVRWMVVLEGQMGPGAQEQPRAIVGKTGLALWNDIGCPI
jgi:hypothetical protein